MGNTVEEITANAFGTACRSELNTTTAAKTQRPHKAARTYGKRKSRIIRRPPSTAFDPNKKQRRIRRNTNELPWSQEFTSSNFKMIPSTRKNSTLSIRSENDANLSDDIIKQLVVMGYGTEKECIEASALTVNYFDFNEVLSKLQQIQKKKRRKRQKRCNDRAMALIDDIIKDANTQTTKSSAETTASSPPPATQPPLQYLSSLDQISDYENEESLSMQSYETIQQKTLIIQSPDVNCDNAMVEISENEVSESEEMPKISHEHSPKHTKKSKNRYLENMKKPKRPGLTYKNSLSRNSGLNMNELLNGTKETIELALSEYKKTNKERKEKMSKELKECKESIFEHKAPPNIDAISHCMFYWNDAMIDKEFIICATRQDGIFLYDINALELDFLCAYPDEINFNVMGIALDSYQHKLHIFGGKGCFGQWFILNLKAKLWEIKNDLSKYKIPFNFIMENPQIIIYDKLLHIYSQGRFLRWFRRKRQFVELPKIRDDNVKNVNYIKYVHKQQRIYVFGGNDGAHKYFDGIWYFYEREWHRFEVTLPYVMKNDDAHDAILGFEHVLFLFYHDKGEIWCIDLVKKEKFLCDKHCKIKNAQYAKIMNSNANIAHCLCMNDCDTRHTVLRLNDIVINQ